jgi:hypothetical protein
MNASDTSVILPENFSIYSTEEQSLVIKYLTQMGDKERIAYLIAKDHLGTSFDIIKSIGYMEWKKTATS